MEIEQIKSMIEKREELLKMVDIHSDELNKFPCLSNGLVSDDVRDSESYKFHKSEYKKSFDLLRDFNGKLTSEQKREMSRYKRLSRKII